MNAAQKAIQRLMSLKVSKQTIDDAKRQGVEIDENATNFEALNAVTQQSGNKKRCNQSKRAEPKSITFDMLERNPYNEKNLKICQRYTELFSNIHADNNGLLLWGNKGTGKSCTAASISAALCEKGFSVRTVALSEIIEGVENGKTSEYVFLNKLSCADLVIFETFGTEPKTSIARKIIYNAIEDRCIYSRPMIVVTNMTPAEMKAETDGIYAYVYQRILNNCTPLQFTGPSW